MRQWCAGGARSLGLRAAARFELAYLLYGLKGEWYTGADPQARVRHVAY